MLVFGTRPEAIKMAPLVKEFQKNTDEFETIVCVTAQHREMLDQVLDLFEIKPDYDLNLMKQGQDLYDVTSRVLLGMRDVLTEVKPDLVLVHGDTTTSTASALAAFYQQIHLGHVEAGLRTNNIYSPWPEEANRQLTSRITAYHFAPTEGSKKNLLDENVKESTISITGNTAIDALFLTLNKIKENKELENNIVENLNTFGYVLKEDKKIILVTGHRRENHGDGFINICNALKEVALRNSEFDIVYPVHLNPNVQKPVIEILSGIENIYLIKPLQYKEFVYLMNKSFFIITDSGGIQEEAPSLGKPVLVMRDTTERPEAVDAGTVKLVGTNSELIVSASQKLINDKEFYKDMSQANNPFGNGEASIKIIEYINSLEK